MGIMGLESGGFALDVFYGSMIEFVTFTPNLPGELMRTRVG